MSAAPSAGTRDSCAQELIWALRHPLPMSGAPAVTRVAGQALHRGG
jgi:hypothetical protein